MHCFSTGKYHNGERVASAHKTNCANIQCLDEFTVGRGVGFTEAYEPIHNFQGECNYYDWIVARVVDKERGLLEIQRHGMPCTKFIIGWQWVYLK